MKQEIETLRSACIAFNQRAAALAEEQSAIEKRVVHLYHKLELLPLNAAQMVKVAKELKEALKERRRIKDNVRYQQAFMAHTKALLDSASKVDKNIVESHERWREESSD